MKTRSNSKSTANNKSDSLIKEEDSVVEESHIVLDFREFQSTTIFQDSTFTHISSDNDTGCLFKINNSCFDTICFKNFTTNTPSCLINNYLPLKGAHLSNGLTYVLVDREAIDKSTDLKIEDTFDSKNGLNTWYTNNCIEFSADK